MNSDCAKVIDELRQLIVAAAPDPLLAAPVEGCGADEPLDRLIPFSSLIVLGVVVAVEDRYRVRLSRSDIGLAMAEGPTLRSLAEAILAICARDQGCS